MSSLHNFNKLESTHRGIVCFVYVGLEYNLFRFLLSRDWSVYYNIWEKKSV